MASRSDGQYQEWRAHQEPHPAATMPPRCPSFTSAPMHGRSGDGLRHASASHPMPCCTAPEQHAKEACREAGECSLHHIETKTRARSCLVHLTSSIHQMAPQKSWRSAFECDESLRVAAPQAHRERIGTVCGRHHLRCSVILACIFALMLGTVPLSAGRAICASHSTARGLATTSATAGTPASFTIQVYT